MLPAGMEPFPYRIVERLPPGGMCDLFVAVRLRDNLPVVIKVLNQRHRLIKRSVDNFLSEGDLLPLLNHPNVVQRVELGSRQGIPFLVLQHIPGVDLRRLISRCIDHNISIDPPLATYIVQELLKALAHVHRARSTQNEPLQLVHRDVNPANTLLHFDGRVLLTDFGIAVTELLQSKEEPVQGKLAFLAPEQIGGDPITQQADIYAAGAILYELTTMHPPFSPVGDDEQSVLQLIANGQVVPPGQMVPNFDGNLEKLVLKAMSRRPAKRFELAEHMAVELGSFRQRSYSGQTALNALLEELFPKERAKMNALYTSLGYDMGL